MKRKSLLFLLLFALLAPWAANAQTRETQTFDFEDQTIPTTWTNDATYPWEVTSARNHTEGGTYSIKSTNEGVNSSTSSIQATFTFAGDGTISFNCLASCESASSYWDYGIFYIDGTQMDRFLNVTDWVSKSYNVELGSHTFKWTFTKDSSAQGNDDCFYVDDIVVDLGVAPTCPKPTLESIDPQNIELDQVSIRWEENGEATDWVIEYSTSSDFANATTLTRNGIPAMVINDLTPATTYYVRVKSVCGAGDESSWSNSVSFTTLNPCAAPTNFVASNITASSATISWTAGYQETAWTVKYKKSSDSSWDNATTVSVSGTPTTSLTGLDGLTTYNVRVFNCTGESDPYLTGNFTTVASFPYSQDFTGSGIPTGWSQYSGLLADVMAGTATLTSTSYGWSNGTSNGVLDGNNIYSNIYGSACKKWIVTPAIPMESGARLTFDVAYTAYSGTAQNPATTGTDDKFVVLVSTDNMATWTILRQWDNAGSEFVLNDLTPATTHLVFDMADYAGQNVIVAFYAESTESNADNNIHVDNVVFELVPSCEKPTGLAVNYTGGTTAEVSWTSDASSWNLMVNGTQINNVTENPYTLTNLSLATTYNVAVQANCSGSTSEWTTPESFNTDMCLPEDQCALTFVLTDTYGDSWNGNAIQVKDVLTGIVLATLANQDLDGTTGEETQTVTLAVCDGRELEFSWVAGNYPGETRYTVTDINGEVIVEGSGAFETFNYTVSCAVATCFTPTNLAATNVLARSAELSWTENGDATEWVIDYNGTTITVNENPYVLEGLTPETAYTVKVKPVCEQEKWSSAITFTTTVACPAPTALTATNVTPTGATISWEGSAESYNLRYGRPGTPDPTAPATIILTAHDVWGDGSGYQMLLDADATAYGDVFTATGGWTATSYEAFEYTIPEGAECSTDATHIVVDGSVSIQIPAGTYDWCITNPTPGDVIYIASSGGNVGGRQNDYVFEAGMTYEFVVRMDDNNQYDQTDVTIYSASDVVWTDLNNVTSPVTLENLDSETLYLVEVQAVCGGEDGVSAWTSSSFTTLSACAVPYELAAEATDTEATLTWSGYQDSYNIQYRTAGFDGYYINETWDGDEIDDWGVYNFESGGGINGTAGVDGTACFAFHWTQNPPQYLISPDLREGVGGKTLTFSYKAYSAYYAESFMVGFAIGEEMTWEDEVATETGDTDWHEYQVVVPEGTEYFVIACTSDNAYYLYIDNIVIYAEDEVVEAGTWMTTTATGTTATLTGLTAETEYEWQVQGTGCTDWSASAYFTTTESTTVTVTQETTLKAGWNWFSTYVEVEDPVTMLQAIEASLGENGIMIKNSRINTEYDAEWGWFGDLDDEGIVNEQMYKIQVSAPCTVTVEGTPANPEEHAITVNYGWNWIGFPCQTTITLENAFDGFAQDGDKIRNSAAEIVYDPEWGWFGDFETLVPGQGYMYYSDSTTPRRLVFPTGEAKARNIANLGNLAKPAKSIAIGKSKSIESKQQFK